MMFLIIVVAVNIALEALPDGTCNTIGFVATLFLATSGKVGGKESIGYTITTHLKRI